MFGKHYLCLLGALDPVRELDVFSATPSGALSAIIPILQMRKQSLSAGENILGFTFRLSPKGLSIGSQFLPL